MRNKKLMSF